MNINTLYDSVYTNSYDPQVVIKPFKHEIYINSLFKFKDSIKYDGTLIVYSNPEYKNTPQIIYSKDDIRNLLQEKDKLYWDQLEFISSKLSLQKAINILFILIGFIAIILSFVLSVLFIATWFTFIYVKIRT